LREVGEEDFRRQVHADFSPLGWHLGHIGVTEAFWILQQCKKEPTLSATYDRCFTPTDNPKPNRTTLPPRTEILAYLATVRERVLAFLESVDFTAAHPLLKDGGIFHMLLQHEEQHNETICLILQLIAASKDVGENKSGNAVVDGFLHHGPLLFGEEESVRGTRAPIVVPAGSFLMGSNDNAKTLDNERRQHEVYVNAFAIDRLPVTNEDFAHFMESGGYHDPSWWTPAGWQWRTRHAVKHPFYWRRPTDGVWAELEQVGAQALAMERPVMHVSWYEADAYARFAGKRLPSEAEWEKSASLGLLHGVGEVWEWTATWFAPYPGFVAHPYSGYSVPYFDGQHRVLRGGSWATRRHVKRTTFRNWYHPWMREIFAGVRCAQDA
jgi:ergothioneine biosynthesis protein EgtB